MIAGKEIEKLSGGIVIEGQIQQAVQITEAVMETMRFHGTQGLAGRIQSPRLAPGYKFEGRVSHDPILVGEGGYVFFAKQHGAQPLSSSPVLASEMTNFSWWKVGSARKTRRPA